MNFFLDIALPYILLYKYWAIFGVTLIAALACPVPPGTLLMASAAFASQGYFSLFWVIIVGSLGNIVGDNLGYFLARRYGRKILYTIGLRKVLESEKYKNIEKRLERRPGFLIFITRFEVFANLAVNLMCGLSKVPYRKYLPFEIAGEIAQVTLYACIGYLVGDNWHVISNIISKSLLFLILLAVLIIAIFWKKIWRK